MKTNVQDYAEKQNFLQVFLKQKRNINTAP